MNGHDEEGYSPNDLKSYVQILTSIRRGAKTSRLKSKEEELEDDDSSDVDYDDTDYSDDNYNDGNLSYNNITKEIDDFLEHTGEGIIFLSDNNEEILNRLQIILAAMKEVIDRTDNIMK
ncbi:hypothetical protein LOTGIDRAFT_155889 [Lottia gigantea]|uniref:Uncharacterized protein n=1 Tax=Lottia gigantea TaxID=225164 RepID=V4B3D8_LOTGI|nr:hypothetical protein LOTGIDRAFT_155889 [Lottia gigantea]ESO82854.1 hypothetical protein LOTGIDRAFT_155889 [Lottia gigantea]